MPAPDVDVELRPSRLRRLAALIPCLLAMLVAPAQAVRLETPWPLLLLVVLPLVVLRMPECAPRRLSVTGLDVQALTATARRRGRIDGPLALTGFALELPVRWNDGRRDRVVVWRDAVDDADYHDLARILRRQPGSDALDDLAPRT